MEADRRRPTADRPGGYNVRGPGFLLLASLPLLLGAGDGAGCVPNNPYPARDRFRNIYYTDLDDFPVHQDPAISYSSAEYDILGLIYEPPLQYHYLKRPFEIIPLTAEAVPAAEPLDAEGRPLPPGTPIGKAERIGYTVRIRKGIRYQPHPCFAAHHWTDEELRAARGIGDLRHTGSRELRAADYVHQVKRMADPRLNCPILSTVWKYIDGLQEYAEALEKTLEAERAKRKAEQGAAYAQEKDERKNPIRLDYEAHPFPGVRELDDRSFQIILKKPYPQIVYWLAMPFFAPVPKEAVDFYNLPPLRENNITLDRFPVGTGPFYLERRDPVSTSDLRLVRNPNFHEESYPAEGDEGDAEAGFLADAGKPLPFFEEVHFKREKESIPRWLKFLQGYYDSSGIPSESFSRAIRISGGAALLSEDLQEKGFRLVQATSPTTYYIAFNMADPALGGHTPEKRKLRQALSIAIRMEEWIQIFMNGRGLAAQGPLPPGFFGHEEAAAGINPFVFDWDGGAARPVRKSLEEARRLLAEAGYPGGRGRDGRPLSVRFVNAWTGSESVSRIEWLRKQFAALGVELVNETVVDNLFEEKMKKGDWQVVFYGWHADYPDPENFLFLLYGPNGKVKNDGENVANYDNPEFNELFERLETLENGEERLDLIRRALKVVREDAPWAFGYHPAAFGLYPDWHRNVKALPIGLNALKYHRVDPVLRDRRRREWNPPNFAPVLFAAAVVLIAMLPAVGTIRRRHSGRP